VVSPTQRQRKKIIKDKPILKPPLEMPPNALRPTQRPRRSPPRQKQWWISITWFPTKTSMKRKRKEIKQDWLSPWLILEMPPTLGAPQRGHLRVHPDSKNSGPWSLNLQWGRGLLHRWWVPSARRISRWNASTFLLYMEVTVGEKYSLSNW